MKAIKYILFIVMLLSFFGVEYYLPALQNTFTSWQAKQLGGSRFPDKHPNIWAWTWLDGSYQKKYQNYLKGQSFIRPSMVRYYSQLNYSLFNDIPHQDIIPGKNSQLYPHSAWTASRGLDFVGEEKIKDELAKLKRISDYLADRGKKLLVLIPPNKVTAQGNYLNEYYTDYPIAKTNRVAYTSALQSLDIPVINFEHFIGAEKKMQFPLYPQGGLHWNYYGFALAADTIHNYLQNQFDFPLPEMSWKDAIEVKEWDRYSDVELYNGANLFIEPKLDPLPYPKITYSGDSLATRVLSVGDSYYKLLHEFGIHDSLFHGDSQFWYYANTLFPKQNKDGQTLKNSFGLSIVETVDAMDLVIITVLEDNLVDFSFGWIDRFVKELDAEK